MSVRGIVMYSALAMALTLSAGATPGIAGEDLGPVLANGGPVGSADLADQRGGTLNQDQLANQIAVVKDNIAVFSPTGNNLLGSISNAEGLFTVLQNTGNNVAIQSETVLNVNIH
jgi:hypothetical protein